MIDQLEIEKHIRFINLGTFFDSKSQGGGRMSPAPPPMSAPDTRNVKVTFVEVIIEKKPFIHT